MNDKPPTADELPLFELPPAAAPKPHPPLSDPKRGARLREADRQQMAWGRIDLDAQLPDEHPARAIWAALRRYPGMLVPGMSKASTSAVIALTAADGRIAIAAVRMSR